MKKANRSKDIYKKDSGIITGTLELVREEKLYRLIPNKKKESRLEASGVILVDETKCLVIFDNLNYIAQIHTSLEPKNTNRLWPAPSLGSGFEDIAIDPERKRVFCLIEALEDVDGLYRGFIAEFDANDHLIRCTRLATEFEFANKGYEGLAFVRQNGKEYLFALCEGNLGTNAKQGGARIDAFAETADGNWGFIHSIFLPKTAEFEDYAGLAHLNGRIAVVSQASARIWIAKIDIEAKAIVPGSEAVYLFPKKSYGNVEGIDWLSEDTLIAVSDKKKSIQPKRCIKKEQSIHVFRIPAV